MTLPATPTPERLRALQAAFKRLGHTLHVSQHGYMAERWGMCRFLPTLTDVEAFLKQIGGKA